MKPEKLKIEGLELDEVLRGVLQVKPPEEKKATKKGPKNGNVENSQKSGSES